MNMRSLMDAAILNQPLDIEVKKVEVPDPKEDEALIKVHCRGVCGSDVHYYEHGKMGRYVEEEQLILGIEIVGEEAKGGKQEENDKKGDGAAGERGVPCGRCNYCKSVGY